MIKANVALKLQIRMKAIITSFKFAKARTKLLVCLSLSVSCTFDSLIDERKSHNQVNIINKL